MGPDPGSAGDADSGWLSRIPNIAGGKDNPIFSQIIDGLDFLKEIHALNSVRYHRSSGCATLTSFLLALSAKYERFEDARE